MRIFYNPAMSTDSHGFSPSAAKPAKVVADWLARGLDIEIVDFEPVTEADLCLAHDSAYVRGVLTGKTRNGHGNYLKSVSESCLWTAGSLLAASRAALTEGITCSPTSGFHHASYDSNFGFCTFNALVITAIKLTNECVVKKVGIIDGDNHYSDGTIDIIDHLELHDIIENWTYGAEFGDREFCQEELLTSLRLTLMDMKDSGVELIILQAGADCHIDDPLCSGSGMTSEEMRERDRFVFTACNKLGMPVCICFGGGYQRDTDGGISKVLELHRATAEEAIKVLRNRDCGHHALVITE